MQNRGSVVLGVIWELVEAFVFALAIFVVVYWFLAQPNQVKGLSMEPTFHDGELILTDKFTYQRSRKPERGEVIILKDPNTPDRDFIKRVIALPGDVVKISQGKVFVNGKQLDESNYLDSRVYTNEESFLREGQSYTVPQDKYFVLGDNRQHSSDSRDFGPITTEELIGRVIFRYWPITRTGIVSKALYPQTL